MYIGKDVLHTLRSELFQHRFDSGLGIQTVISIMGADGLFNGFFAGKIDLQGGAVLRHLPMLGRIGGGVGIDRDGSLFLFCLVHLIRPFLNAFPDHIHIAGFQLFKMAVHIGQRGGGIQKRLGLVIGEFQFLHRHHNVLPDGVLIGLV